jgi:RNA-binding protein YlmH
MRDIKEFDGLYARLEDLKKRAVRGEMGISAFLSPRELHYAEVYLRRSGACFLSFGGYESAERKRIYVLPEYMESVEKAEEILEYGCETAIVAL